MEIVIVAEMEQQISGKTVKCFNRTICSGECNATKEAYAKLHKQCMSLCRDFERELGGNFTYNWVDEKLIDDCNKEKDNA